MLKYYSEKSDTPTAVATLFLSAYKETHEIIISF